MRSAAVGLYVTVNNIKIFSAAKQWTCGEFRSPEAKKRGTEVAQWLGCCATNRKVAGSIPDGVIGIFH